MKHLFLGLPAPAKLNLFLHVLGRRDDGYHLLQSAFQLIDLADSLDLESRADQAIVREGDVIGAPAADLCVRAAQLLREATGTRSGVTIRVRKQIPAGAGLGGGSSDAATTLIALNRLWGLRLPREALAMLGARLGADVPFFVHGHNAFVEGVGERVMPIALPERWFALIWPGVHLATAAIFSDPGLTRNTEPTTMAVFSATAESSRSKNPGEPRQELWGRNDLQAVACQKSAEVGQALEFLAQHGQVREQTRGQARMTGSGSAVFVALDSELAAKKAIEALPPGWSGWAVKSFASHPLSMW